MSIYDRPSLLWNGTEKNQKGILGFFCTQYVKWLIPQALSQFKLNCDLGLSEPLEKSRSVSVLYTVMYRATQGLVGMMTVCWGKARCAYS